MPRTRRSRATPVAPLQLTGEQALSTMILPRVAVAYVLSGPQAVTDALLAALAAEDQHEHGGNGASTALRELLLRMRDIPDGVLAEARARRDAFIAAQVAYDAALIPITNVLYKKTEG